MELQAVKKISNEPHKIYQAPIYAEIIMPAATRIFPLPLLFVTLTAGVISCKGQQNNREGRHVFPFP
ncbi:MAG TPA: hypothetical protein ENN63_05435 [Bacteroidetes bacterium]|nr:hypothetical protein [Bacteroidota bacterium]